MWLLSLLDVPSTPMPTLICTHSQGRCHMQCHFSECCPVKESWTHEESSGQREMAHPSIEPGGLKHNARGQTQVKGGTELGILLARQAAETD